MLFFLGFPSNINLLSLSIFFSILIGILPLINPANPKAVKVIGGSFDIFFLTFSYSFFPGFVLAKASRNFFLLST